MRFPFKAAQAMVLAACSFVAVTGFAQLADDEIALSGSLLDDGSAAKFITVSPHAHLANGQAHARQGVPNIDSLVNWNDHYFAPGYIGTPANPVYNNIWYTNMVGNPPNNHGTTYINAPIVPVDIELLDANGNQRYRNGIPLYLSAAPYIPYVVSSPVFQNSSYTSSSTPTQFTDAVQRAEYYSKAKEDWHTILVPSVKTKRLIKLPFGKYRFAVYTGTGQLAYVLADADTFGNALFPTTVDDSTPVGAAENHKEITTKDISTFLFANTFLYVGNPSNCCILGYHTYDYEPGTDANGNVEQRYVLNYSSFITPGIFRNPNFQDITAHSHEIAETFNDPFVVSDGVRNLTPWWLSANGNCQNDLEVGDVVEGLPNSSFPVQLPVTDANGQTIDRGYLFHPQNEALLQFFQEGPSNAIDGAYSYPNESILTGPTSVQKPGCGF